MTASQNALSPDNNSCVAKLHYPSVWIGGEDLTIFKEMHETRVVDPGWDYRELLRMLSEAIARGYVEQVPVMKPHRTHPDGLGIGKRKPGRYILSIHQMSVRGCGRRLT
jgi:hypothetical protein